MPPKKTHSCRHFGPLMGYCHHQVHKAMDRKLRSMDISPMQSRALRYLCSTEGDVNQRMLEQYLMVKPSTVNGIVSRLEEKGLITRTVSGSDGRCRILRPTETGRACREALDDVVRRVERQMEQGFTPEEVALLHSLLQRVADNLVEEEDSLP